MTQGQFEDCVDEIQGAAHEDVFRTMIEVMSQALMESEVSQHIGATRHERTSSRTGKRNGYKPRKLNTRMGELALDVPQVRDTAPYHPSLFAKYQRSERALLVACAEMYFMGVSTRKVQKVLEKMGGLSLSASTVSCVAQELDIKLQEFRDRRLDEHAWPYIMLDACYLKVRKHGRVRNLAILVVSGVNDAGHREILTWRPAELESEDTWTEVLRDLRQRGLSGVQWVISDGHEGIRAAVRSQLSTASWQRCWTHFMRNALAKVGHAHKKGVARELAAARKCVSLEACLQEAERLAGRWEKQYPRLATQIREQFEETMQVWDLPKEHQRRVYTSNMIERVMREIKRRTKVVGIFPNEASADRLVGAQLIERHESWSCEQARYLDMSRLEDMVEERMNL